MGILTEREEEIIQLFIDEYIEPGIFDPTIGRKLCFTHNNKQYDIFLSSYWEEDICETGEYL